MNSTRKPARTGQKSTAGRNAPVAHARAGPGAIEEFYARALAIERAAAERYRDFANEMASNGNVQTAELFLRLAHFESGHAERLLAATAGMDLPQASRRRLRTADACASEIPTYEFLYRRVPPLHALLMALAAERRAKAFFEHTQTTSADSGIRKLAGEFAREEAEHIAWLEEAVAVQPQTSGPSDELID